ncbi:glycosyltransferase family 2 protein [Paenibacillus sp. LjRoot56]|uniref:glycosyltransferase family 2 protein n=1 Tax=Paenibacillus sp. LjRoot56 TaxID=3342333 RepID=UPI003ED056C1
MNLKYNTTNGRRYHLNYISIIVPMYNVEKWIESCISSILNQSFSNFELILVNDGSPDKSGEIADEYAKKDSRIKVIHKNNGGLSSARNTGINAATGKYIAFVDSDDQVSTEYLSHMIQVAEENNCDTVVCGYQTIPNNVQVVPKYTLNKVVSGKELILSSSKVHSNNDLCFSPRFLFNLNLMKKKNIRFNEKVLIAEDTIFNLEFLLESKRTYATSKILYYYTVNNPDSIMRTPYKSNLESNLVLQYQIKKELSIKFHLFEHKHYRNDMSDYYIKSILPMMKNNLHNSKDTNKIAGLTKIINYDMFRDSTKEIGFSYKSENIKEYLYYLAIKFKLMFLLKREFQGVNSQLGTVETQ